MNQFTRNEVYMRSEVYLYRNASDGGDFLKLSRKVLTLRPFLSGTLFRAYWSIFEYRMAGFTYRSGGYVHFLDVLTSL